MGHLQIHAAQKALHQLRASIPQADDHDCIGNDPEFTV
jgi:hypothetical protein